jgi:hypothetical protein
VPWCLDVSDEDLRRYLPEIVAEIGTMTAHRRLNGGSYNTGVQVHHATTSKKDVDSLRSWLWRSVQVRLTATAKVAVAWPLLVKRSSGSRVKLPAMVTVLSVIEVRSPWCRVLLGWNEPVSPKEGDETEGQWARPRRETRSETCRAQAWTGGVVERAVWGSVCPVQPCRHPAQGNDLVADDGPLAVGFHGLRTIDDYARLVSAGAGHGLQMGLR